MDDSSKFDPQFITQLHQNLVVNKQSQEVGELEPVEESLVYDIIGQQEQLIRTFNEYIDSVPTQSAEQEYVKAGLQMIRGGKAAVVILAGG